MNVLITGANGFVGSHIVEYALTKDVNVFAAIRQTSNTRYISDEKVKKFVMDFSSEESITEGLEEFYNTYGSIDYIIHNAGLTKTLRSDDYDRVNYQLTLDLISALDQSRHEIKKFTYISSMAAASPGIGDQPITIDQKGEPVSRYGVSKKKTEDYIEESCPLPYLILRPPPVFGPRDEDMFTVFKMLSQKMELYIGGHNQLLSFVYVKDLARGVMEATLSDVSNKKYFLSDGKYYDGRGFNQLVKKELVVKTLQLSLPLFLVYIVAFFSELGSKITGKVSQLNLEKIKELKCPNWTCDSSDFYKDLNIQANYTLEQGIRETVEWYKKESWL